MASVFGIGEITKNRKLDGKLNEEINKIDKDINEIFEKFRDREPAAYAIIPLGIETLTDLIKRTLNDIEKYKNLLQSYRLNLNNFPEVFQLENSIKEISKRLEEGRKQIYNLSRGMKLIQIIQDINQDIEIKLHKIQNFWNIHKNKLHRLRIIE